MSYQTTIEFTYDSNHLFTIHSPYREYSHDVIISSLHTLISVLEFSSQKFDEDYIDQLKNRLEDLKESKA